ncbi:MAG: hypothetical protein ACM3PZ_02950 [Bacillota bacterium]
MANEFEGWVSALFTTVGLPDPVIHTEEIEEEVDDDESSSD